MPDESSPVRNDILGLLVAGLTAVPLIFLAVHYPGMPARVPVHWNIHGTADRWAAKSFLAVFFAPILSVLLQIMLALLTTDLANALGAVHGAGEASNYKRAALRANLGLMQPLRLLLAGMLFVIAFLQPLGSSAPHALQWASLLLLAFVAALLLVAVVGVVKIIRLQRKWESAAPSLEPEFQPENWRWGAFYYNPDDPNFLVHKRLGAGFTLNFAHPRAKFHALLLIAIVAFTLVAAANI